MPPVAILDPFRRWLWIEIDGRFCWYLRIGNKRNELSKKPNKQNFLNHLSIFCESDSEMARVSLAMVTAVNESPWESPEVTESLSSLSLLLTTGGNYITSLYTLNTLIRANKTTAKDCCHITAACALTYSAVYQPFLFPVTREPCRRPTPTLAVLSIAL